MARATLSTHVLDTTNGRPAAGVAVSLSSGTGVVARAVTGVDGRVTRLGEEHEPGSYQLAFDVGAYFRAQGLETFLGTVTLEVRLAAGHQHIPLLVSRYGVTSYLGS